MAIYSCNLSSVGRSTHAAGTAGAACRYITRPGAEAIVLAHGMPADGAEAQAWMNREEAASRANARVIDRVMVALPRELSKAQRLELTRDFVSTLTNDRIPFLAAIHQEGADAHNPHAHIILRDRDLVTGERVLRFSDSTRDRAKLGLEPKGVELVRRVWEERANAALECAGLDVRIDRRTLEAQGIDREPTIHIGAEAARIERLVERPASKKCVTAQGREIDYPSIDQGRTRVERNEEIIDGNLRRQSLSPNLETRVWAQFERGQRQLDRRLEVALIAQARQRTADERALKAGFRDRMRELRATRRHDYLASVAKQHQALGDQVKTMRQRQADERDVLHRKQTGFWPSFFRAVDITGGTRRKHQATRRDLSALHKQERGLIAADHRVRWMALKDAIRKRFAPQEEELTTQRRCALSALREMHGRAEAMADGKRQHRAAHRERDRRLTEEQIAELKIQARAKGSEAPTPSRQLRTAQQRPSASFGNDRSAPLVRPKAQPRDLDLGR